MKRHWAYNWLSCDWWAPFVLLCSALFLVEMSLICSWQITYGFGQEYIRVLSCAKDRDDWVNTSVCLSVFFFLHLNYLSSHLAGKYSVKNKSHARWVIPSPSYLLHPVSLPPTLKIRLSDCPTRVYLLQLTLAYEKNIHGMYSRPGQYFGKDLCMEKIHQAYWRCILHICLGVDRIGKARVPQKSDKVDMTDSESIYYLPVNWGWKWRLHELHHQLPFQHPHCTRRTFLSILALDAVETHVNNIICQLFWEFPEG